jgi:hypothetical protein
VLQNPFRLVVETSAGICPQAVSTRLLADRPAQSRQGDHLLPADTCSLTTCLHLSTPALQGPSKKAFYLPDIDSWDKWAAEGTDIREVCNMYAGRQTRLAAGGLLCVTESSTRQHGCCSRSWQPWPCRRQLLNALQHETSLLHSTALKAPLPLCVFKTEVLSCGCLQLLLAAAAGGQISRSRPSRCLLL